jgi:hypothetical protein
METTDIPDACPRGVKQGVALWLLGSSLNGIRVVRAFDWSDWVMYPRFAILVILWLSVAWFVLQRKNWARWILVGLVAFAALGLPRMLLQLPEASLYQAVMGYWSFFTSVQLGSF